MTPSYSPVPPSPWPRLSMPFLVPHRRQFPRPSAPPPLPAPRGAQAKGMQCSLTNKIRLWPVHPGPKPESFGEATTLCCHVCGCAPFACPKSKRDLWLLSSSGCSSANCPTSLLNRPFEPTPALRPPCAEQICPCGTDAGESLSWVFSPHCEAADVQSLSDITNLALVLFRLAPLFGVKREANWNTKAETQALYTRKCSGPSLVSFETSIEATIEQSKSRGPKQERSLGRFPRPCPAPRGRRSRSPPPHRHRRAGPGGGEGNRQGQDTWVA